MNNCPHCLGVSGFQMDAHIKAKRFQEWSGQNETGDMWIVKETNHRCMDCGKSVTKHLKEQGVLK